MATERRAPGRVPLSCDYTARIMAIDGTWQRACHLADGAEGCACCRPILRSPPGPHEQCGRLLEALGRPECFSKERWCQR